MDNLELKPCPFCGGKPEITEVIDRTPRNLEPVGFGVKCDQCGIIVAKMKKPSKHGTGGQRTILIWYTTKKEAPIVAHIVSFLQISGFSYKKAIEILEKCKLAIESIAKI